MDGRSAGFRFVAIEAGTGGRDAAGMVEDVFDGNRDAGEGTGQSLSFETQCPLAGSLPVHRDGRLAKGLEPLGSFEVMIDDLDRSNLPGPDLVGQFDQAGVVHHQSTRRPLGTREIHGIPAGTASAPPRSSRSSNQTSVPARSQPPSTTFPPANTIARPSPVMSMAGTGVPFPPGGVGGESHPQK